MSNSEERGHARYSPSGLQSIANCPGYLNDESAPPHPLTLAGSRCHDAVETGDDSLLESENERTLTDLARRMRDTVLKKFGGADSTVLEPLLEIPVHPTEPHFGYCDLLAVRDNRALLVDYKFGYLQVTDAKDNLQGKSYAVGVFLLHPEVESVDVTFLLVRYKKISSHTFHRSQLRTLIGEVYLVIDNALNATSEDYNPSAANCFYCGRRACPRLSEVAVGIAKKYDPDLVVPEDVHSSNLDDAESVGAILKVASIMESWVKSVKFHAKLFYTSTGEDPEGFEVKEIPPRKKIANTRVAHQVVTAYGVDFYEFLGACSISNEAFDRLVSDKLPRGEKGAGVKDAQSQLLEQAAIEFGNPSIRMTLKTK